MSKIFMTFVWTGIEVTHGGKFLVAWKRVQRSLHLGGLCVMDFKLQGRARLRWLWLSRMNDACPWALHPVSDDATMESFFQASTSYVIGDG
jgi:hypothetical protein